jgi:hypothetical protein
MKVQSRDIRPIPRQSIGGYMSLGIIEDNGDYYAIQMEPQSITLPDGSPNPNITPLVRIIQFMKMQRSPDILDGDTNELIPLDVSKAIEQFAVEREVLTPKRVEIAIRMAAALSLSPTKPRFYHKYQCLMHAEKMAKWYKDGRKGMSPPELVSTYDCWMCPKVFREPCIGKLLSYKEETDEDRYVADLESDPTRTP